MSKEIKDLKAEVDNLKAKVKRLENELNLLYEENITFSDVIADIKTIKQDLMRYSRDFYFENAW